MSVSSLKVLQDKRDALLLAEVAALLHDVGKLSSQFIDQMSEQPSAISTGFEHENAIQKIDKFVEAQFLDALKSTKMRDRLRLDPIQRQEQVGQALDLILHHDRAKHSAFLVRLLNRCDGADSGADKGTTRDQGLHKETKQSLGNTLIASAFGKETPAVRIDTARIDTSRQKLSQKISRRLYVFLDNPKQKRSEILRLVNVAYRCGLGETRRSANDVTLWDHSFSVATLYKTSLATLLLHNSLDIDHLRWRILRLNFDVLALYAKALKIGDLLGYQRVVNEACEAVKKLIEEEYPLGNEIYRDSTGIYFTFPDLDLPADLMQEIRRRVEAVDPELSPRINVTEGVGTTAQEQLKGILGKARSEAQKDLAHPFNTHNLSPIWQQKWDEAQREPGKWEVCPVCGLRPKREEREVCETCERRRKGRMQEWLRALNNAAQSQPTIWTNEVADKNGRLALVVGQFDLAGWLSGDLVRTMLVKVEQNNPNGCTAKNPSPARLRRIWETTQRFWETVLDEKDSRDNPLLPCALSRLILSGKLQKDPGAPDPQEQPICELLVEGFKVSVVWHDGRFIVCDNPDYFHTITDKELEKVLKKDASCSLSTSEGYKKKDQKIGKFTIETVEQQTSYIPVIPLLAEPQIFMALVPADRALKVVNAIKAKYEREMGKVQNRLPLHLGVVFASRRMPLQAILDAGRAMLKRSGKDEQAKVENVTTHECKDDNWPAEPQITLCLRGGEITLTVPTVMGDGTTKDLWYPYWQLQGDLAGGTRWVHVNDLKQGDTVHLTPSTFDFEFLDAASRRFEVYYDEKGRRPRRTRPFYLQDVERLENLWNEHFRHLKRSQFSQMLQTIETARQRWNIPVGDDAQENVVFCRFVEDTLANASWPKGHAWKDLSDAQRKQRTDAAARGELADWAELHLEILKEKMEGEQP